MSLQRTKRRPRVSDTGAGARKPRVLVVGPTLKQMGGVGMFNEILLASPLNEHFEVLHLDTTRGAAGEGKVGTLAPVNFLFFFRQHFQLLRILLFRRPQMMHQPITDRISFWKEGAFMLTARLFGVKVVGQVHGNQFTRLAESNRRLVHWGVVRVMRLPNVVIALSEGWRRYLLGKVSPKLSVVVVPNTVDADFAALAHQIAALPRRHETKSCRALFVGSLGTRKGLFDILKAVPVVRKQAPDVEFVLVGGVEVGAEREKVEQAQAEALAAGGVTFPGIVTGQPKATLFAESDVFILPSYNENFPIAVLEAMAAGLPLVVTPVGALPEVLEEGRNCFFVEPGDCEALADRIVRLAHDPELRYLMGSANLSLYLEKFAPEVMLGKIEDLYNSLLKNHR